MLLLGGVALLLTGAAGFVLLDSGRIGDPFALQTARQRRVVEKAEKATLELPAPDLFRPLSPEDAAKVNAERPVVIRPDQPAKGFALHTDSRDKMHAVDCLSQAVYYEAASEGVDGGRAIAQVVLNRVRHPGFPATVCGVVYQGSDRPTGCQFSFTCDGSLLRTPEAAIWERSRKIAGKALAGDVFAQVGHSTHYHADYVLPYWADSLDKTVQIGRHIFYRFRGSLGDARIFRKAYGGVEIVPQPAPLAETMLAPPAGTIKSVSEIVAEVVARETQGPAPLAAPSERPIADEAKGTLLADEIITSHPSLRRKSTDCSASPESRQIKPLRAEQLQAGATAQSC